MLDKILKMFFVKRQENKVGKLTIIRPAISSNSNMQKKEEHQVRKNVNTSLTKYFSSHRGLNLVERGYLNISSTNENLRN